jgi:hypothetical protein
MSGSTTPRLGLPYIAAGQASPEVALATALNRLDCLSQGVVQSVGTNTPPGSPAQGATYILGASPTGAWAGRANDVAYYVGTGWIIFDPSQGWEFFNVADSTRYRWSGSAWATAGGAGAGFGRADVAPPAVSTWTWVNQGGATATDRTYGGGTGVSIFAPASVSENIRMLVRTAPAAPYTLRARVSISAMVKNFIGGGIAFRSSGGGQIHAAAIGNNGQLFVARYTNPTTFASADFTAPLSGGLGSMLWLRLVDDNTNKSWAISPDGFDWVNLFSVARATYFTPDQIGFFVNPNNSAGPNLDAAISLFSWEVA